MARGRKKGGLNLNYINNEDELIKMIINQINSLNKKIKDFKNKGIEEHQEFVKVMNSDYVQYTDSGTISKSKGYFKGKSKIELKRTLAGLHKTNNNDFFGTTRKYNKEVTKGITYVRDFTKQYFEQKGYDEKFIQNIVNNKDFFAQVFTAFKEGDANRYGSSQVIEKIALNYEDSGMNERERDRILSNIEYSRNTMDYLKEAQKAVDEIMRNKRRR